jgi:hypothetical protein
MPPRSRRSKAKPSRAVLSRPRCCASSRLHEHWRFRPAEQPVVADNIHAWVGQEAAIRTGAPISLNNLIDDERTLRDLAFPPIEPTYDRIR